MNSCLWDLSRYRSNFLRNYREDLERLFQRLDQVLPTHCLMIWSTTMPVAEVVSGGFILRDAPGCPSRLREDVMEANFYSSREAARRGFDVLDLHFHFRHAGQHRLSDGVHWDERAHRYLSQLLLAHVADAWGVILPAHNPVGRWIRDGPVGRQPDRADRRHPRDHRRRHEQMLHTFIPFIVCDLSVWHIVHVYVSFMSSHGLRTPLFLALDNIAPS
uniref:Uncharacterized protein n=1 Tax=Mus spicilegus TaxID=10103 RepID=A0A8C6GB00_MUSSI